MTLEEIRRFTNSIADKNRSGKAFTEQQFNDASKVINIELFNEQFALAVKLSSEKDLPLSKILMDFTPLKEFKVYDYDITLTSGVGSLPNDYRHYLYLKTNPSSGVSRDVDVVDDLSFNMIQNAMFVFDLSQKPQSVMYQGNVKVIPSNTEALVMGYLKTPATPYYDWVIKTSTRQIIYMPASSLYDSGTLYADSSMLTTLYTGVTHPSGATAHPSETTELEWREDIHPEFAKRLLIKMGIPLKDMELYQMVKTEEQ